MIAEALLLTALTLGAGYKGGEIVPSFFIGATLGAALSAVFGLPIGFCAAIGMTAFFGAVTNCQIAAAVISVELFGANGFVFFAVAAFASRICFANLPVPEPISATTDEAEKPYLPNKHSINSAA